MFRGGYEHLANIHKWQSKRKEIGVPWDAILLISVGELSERKNHKVVVKTLQKLPDNYWYVIVGKGLLERELREADGTGRLIILGYRTDVPELLKVSDIFVFPSLQEGLPVALMEAMSCGLPCVVSNIRGNVDLIDEGKGGYYSDYYSEAEFKTSVIRSDDSFGKYNKNIIRRFSIEEINCAMKEVYENSSNKR